MTDTQWDPGRLLELSGSYWKTCALHAAVALDVFSALDPDRRGAEDLAEKCGCNSGALTRLLNALTAMGLLTKDGDTYGATSSARVFLSRHSDRYIGHIIMHHHHLMPSWAELDQAVKTGRPVRERASHGNEQQRASFLMGMFNMAMATAPRVVPLVDLGGRRHLLDLGGGPGTYAIQFCRAYPELKATLFDLPTTRPFAEKTIARFNLSDRITFSGGNYLEDDLGSGYDVAWLSQILHGEGPVECQKLIDKAVASLVAGGLIIIHEFILDNDMAGPLFPTLFSLNMLVGTPAGQSYSQAQITKMLAQAGAENIQHISFDSPNDSGLIVGTAQR
ncbi:MAG: methyltransferase [Desulfobacterales bacterium]